MKYLVLLVDKYPNWVLIDAKVKIVLKNHPYVFLKCSTVIDVNKRYNAIYNSYNVGVVKCWLTGSARQLGLHMLHGLLHATDCGGDLLSVTVESLPLRVIGAEPPLAPPPASATANPVPLLSSHVYASAVLRALYYCGMTWQSHSVNKISTNELIQWMYDELLQLKAIPLCGNSNS